MRLVEPAHGPSRRRPGYGRESRRNSVGHGRARASAESSPPQRRNKAHALIRGELQEAFPLVRALQALMRGGFNACARTNPRYPIYEALRRYLYGGSA